MSDPQSSSSQAPSSESITCYIRCRPLNKGENELGAKCVEIVDNNQQILLKLEENKSFKFDNVFSEEAKQSDIFESIGKPMLISFLKGYNGTIFAYGQTGSGKTHTMMGPLECLFEDDNSNQGLIPNIIQYFFTNKDEVLNIITLSSNDKPEKVSYSLTCSCLEIYQEHVIDLLNKDSNEEKLSIREDAKKGMYIENLTEISIDSSTTAKEALIFGLKNRHVASTNMNTESSRSHLIFSLFLQSSFEMSDGLVITRTSRLHLVDLAGSERQKLTNAMGQRLKEAGMINKSLSTLGTVINSVIEFNEGKTKHIPFRDSKLTYYLKDSLGGNSKTIIIGNISQSFIQIQETFNTLLFVQRAKMIKNKVTLVENVNDTTKLLQNEIKRLNKIIEGLNLRILSFDGESSKKENGAEQSTPNEQKKPAPAEENQISLAYINEIQILIEKIERLFSFEEKLNENFKFLEMSSIASFENFLVEKEVYESELKTTIDSLSKSVIEEHAKNNDVINDKIEIFNLLTENKQLKQEIELYKTITNFFISQTNQSETKQKMSKEIIQEFIQTNQELKVFFEKTFSSTSQIKIIEKTKIDKLKLQIDELKIKNEENEKTIKDFQNENFLLTMEISKYKELDDNGYGSLFQKKSSLTRENSSEIFCDNLRQSMQQNHAGNESSLCDFKLQTKDLFINEINSLKNENNRLHDKKEKMEEYFKEIYEDVMATFLLINNNENNISSLIQDYKSQTEVLLQKLKNDSSEAKYQKLIKEIFKIFKSKEKVKTLEKAKELMQNIQETLELHKMYINSQFYKDKFQSGQSNEVGSVRHTLQDKKSASVRSLKPSSSSSRIPLPKKTIIPGKK